MFSYRLFGSPVRAKNVLIAERKSVLIASSLGRKNASASSINRTRPIFKLLK